MIHSGYHIKQVNDPLLPGSLKGLATHIQHPSADVKQLIERLRILKNIDPNAYREYKTRLPYFVTSLFHPAVRRKEHFSAIYAMVLDIDHLASAEFTAEQVKEKIKKDTRVALAFTSPGGDGLKVLIKLARPCKDSAFYAMAYQKFAAEFAHTYQLEKLVDFRTHDVTRAHFMSYDPEPLWNEQSESIDLEHYRDTKLPDDLRKVIDDRKHEASDKPKQGGPSPEVLAAIRQKLNPNYRPKLQKNITQTGELLSVITELEQQLSAYGLRLESALPINYGRQLKISTGNLWAEINLFHGKKGFSLVKTTKTGSSTELADLSAEVLREILGI